MTKRKRTQVTFEMHEVTVTRLLNADTLLHGLCTECGAAARFALPDCAATLTGLSPREIFRQIEAGKIHFRDSSEGAGFICLESMLGESPAPLKPLLRLESGESHAPEPPGEP